MNNDEYKQWLVERVEYLLQTCVDELTSKRLQFEVVSDRCLTKWNEVRNIVLGSAAFIATILSTFLSIETDTVKRGILIQWLGVDIGIGIVTAFSLYVIRGVARRKLRNIQRGYLAHESTIDYLKGFFAKWLLDIEKITPDNLKAYFYLCGAVYGNLVPLYDAYQDGLKWRLFWGIKDEIKLERDVLKVNIGRTKKFYKSHEQVIKAEKELPQEPLKFVDTLQNDDRFSIE